MLSCSISISSSSSSSSSPVIFSDNVTTCQAMATIQDQLNGPSTNPNETEICSLSTDCLEVTCSNEDLLSFQLIILPCFSPPAVRIVLSDLLKYDYIFHQSEVDRVEGTIRRIRVTLEHVRKDAIGLEVCGIRTQLLI